MAKILLVEDDNNLREIYEARLQAEGYEIVSAPDGEAALVVAKKEMPDLVISDVMMPRISGFEMLDILRNTEGLKQVKVIMLTALGQAEDKTRADSLGADRYLVKSQVTLEDIVKAAAELLAGDAPPAPTTPSTAAAAAEMAAPTPVAMPMATPPAPEPPQPVPEPVMPVVSSPTADPTTPLPTPTDPVPEPVSPALSTPAAPQAAPLTPPTTSLTPPEPPQAAPMPPATPSQPVVPPTTPPVPQSTADDQLVANAVKDLVDGTPGSTPATPVPTPTPLVSEPPAAPVAPPVPVSEPSIPTPLTPTPPPSVPPTTPPAPPVPAPAPEPTTDNLVGGDARTKRVIQPLPTSATPTTTDLNELMAKEGHALDTPQHEVMGMLPHQPGHVISPNPVSATGQPEDPNKISL